MKILRGLLSRRTSRRRSRTNINNTIITYFSLKTISKVLCLLEFVLCSAFHSFCSHLLCTVEGQVESWMVHTQFLLPKKKIYNKNIDDDERRRRQRRASSNERNVLPFKIHRPVIVHEANYLFLRSLLPAPYQFSFVILLIGRFSSVYIIYAKFVLIKVHRSRIILLCILLYFSCAFFHSFLAIFFIHIFFRFHQKNELFDLKA